MNIDVNGNEYIPASTEVESEDVVITKEVVDGEVVTTTETITE